MDSRNHTVLYLSLILLEGALILLVRRLAAVDRRSLRDLVGRPWRGPVDVARDALIAAAMWLTWIGVMHAVRSWLPASPGATVNAMLPSGLTESLLWIVLSISAGFAEELAFRGYLQQKVASVTGQVAIGIAVQAIVFGVIHGYQGMLSVVRIVFYGGLFGIVAFRRKSLRPGMMAHAWTDIAAGLLR